MTCEHIKERLDDYHDGLLSEQERAEVQDHLSTCLDCRRQSLQLQDLLERASRLSGSARPERDLWPEIQQRIKGTREPQGNPLRLLRLPRWSYLAAAALAAAAISLPLIQRNVEVQRPPLDELSSAPQAPIAAEFIEADLARSEDGVLQTKVDLVTLLETRRGRLDPATLADLEENLRVLNLAINEIRQALDEQPDDAWLSHRLAARYRRESALLNSVSRV